MIVEGIIRMPIKKFTAFYPSQPFWAINKINFDDPNYEASFEEQMAEEVFSKEEDAYTIKVCRDGRILLRIEAIEQKIKTDLNSDIDTTIQQWGEYLDYLNTFYLLLDSSTLEIAHLSYFNLHEITNRDAFRVRYEDGKWVGENLNNESISSVLQMDRYLSNYPSNIPISMNSRIMTRRIISQDVIKHAAKLFSQAITSPSLNKILASYAKSLSEHKIGNYETAIILSWFIIENAIRSLWEDHLDKLNEEANLGKDLKKIPSPRKTKLTGSDYTIDIVSNTLELLGVLSNLLFRDIDKVRKYRNDIAHIKKKFKPSAKESRLTIETAQEMIGLSWGFRFVSSTAGLSISGL